MSFNVDTIITRQLCCCCCWRAHKRKVANTTLTVRMSVDGGAFSNFRHSHSGRVTETTIRLFVHSIFFFGMNFIQRTLFQYSLEISYNNSSSCINIKKITLMFLALMVFWSIRVIRFQHSVEGETESCGKCPRY